MSFESLTEIGLYGKIPSRGDFITHGLPATFIESWSEWLQAVLAVSREQLGNDWLETYLTSPVWHFALSNGVCSDQTMLGSMMPSVDQVGRHFPFTLARSYQTTPVKARFASDCYQQMQQQVLKTLDDDFDMTAWLAQLAGETWRWPEPHNIETTVPAASNSRPSWMIAESATLSATDLLHHSYRKMFGRYCLWWTDGSELVAPCTLVSSGLPQVSQFAAMLNGDWQRWGWQPTTIKIAGAA